MEALVDRLFKLLVVQRHIEEGKGLILNNKDVLTHASLDDEIGPRLFYVLSGWTEYSAIAAEVVRTLASAHRPGTVPLSQKSFWIEAGMANYAYFESRDSDVQKRFSWVKETAELYTVDPDVMGTLFHVKGRTAKRNAQYPSGLESIRTAKLLYQQAGLEAMVAVAKVTEGWLLMQTGAQMEANRCWSEAYEFLKESQDWTTLGNIKFGQSRRLDHIGRDTEAAEVMEEAINLYSRCDPSHRTLSRALLEAANQCFRMVPKEMNHATAAKLYQTGSHYIERVEKLLNPSDYRNVGRKLLCQVNQQLCAPYPLAAKLRLAAQHAYDFAKQHGDMLIMTRARLKQAVVENRVAPLSDDEISVRLKARVYALEAAELACVLQNDRLKARIHTFLGNSYLEKKDLLYDPDKAALECDQAVRAMAEHEDNDYVVDEIRRLIDKINCAVNASKTIFLITERAALAQPLDVTIKAAEHAIIQALAESLGDNGKPHRIAALLGTADRKISEHLGQPRLRYDISPPEDGDCVVFRITKSTLNQSLAKTRRAMEHAIVRAACLRHGCNIRDVARVLSTGHGRIAEYFPVIEAELKRSGCS